MAALLGRSYYPSIKKKKKILRLREVKEPA